MNSTYIVRPYFGFDCDSDVGFNNGRYLDDIEVTADNETQAAVKARAIYLNKYCIKSKSFIDGAAEFGLDVGLYEQQECCDEQGNEKPADHECDDTCHYRYTYIDFLSDVSLKS